LAVVGCDGRLKAETQPAEFQRCKNATNRYMPRVPYLGHEIRGAFPGKILPAPGSIGDDGRMGLFNLSNWWRPNRAEHKTSHMTFTSKTVARSMSRTRLFFKRQLWIFPVIAVVALTIGGFFLRRAIESTMKESLRGHMQTLLDVETAMLDTWFKHQATVTELWANDRHVREHVYKLLAEAEPGNQTGGMLKESPSHRALEKELAPAISAHDYIGYIVVDKRQRILSASHEELIGREIIAEYQEFVSRALGGETNICPPFQSITLQKDEFGEMRMGVPTMFVSAPIRDERFQVVAALGLRIRPEREFTQIMQRGRIGETGETYAIDKSGRMVSNSRFDEQMMLLGLIPDQKNSRSLVNLQLRDPGGDMTRGYRPKVHRDELPLTRLALAATGGKTGYDVDGYRDYRGVESLGAWTWLPKYQIAVAVEIDRAEAYRPLTILSWAFWSLFILLGLSSIGIFVFSLVVARLQREAQSAAIESKKLGQYRLEQKLGSGAMGIVYKGHHAILRRPTAIKLLSVDKVDENSIERFEREVQITSQLNHPNTVAIYDYGRTDEGVFYYAMEYLDGIDLQSLVEKYGPQSEARIIHILQQVCGSLYEAHSLGLVHRDIKPSNLMLNRRGAEPDVVKVLDFGLVKALDERKQASRTATGGLTGTPLYMSPEAIQTPQSVDPRSDLYAVGAVGYFLLTGHPVFEATGIVELCQQHIDAVPKPPSQRLGNPVSPELENALLKCLEKSRAKRPQTARDLSLLLARCTASTAWSIEEADAWWGRHERRQSLAPPTPTAANPADSPHATNTAYGETYVGNVE
jgi:tRNA A-37 threonylcarbamoyl transferase component Bud32